MEGKLIVLHTIDGVAHHKEFDSIDEMLNFVAEVLNLGR